MIDIQQLSVAYRRGKNVLDQLDLQLDSGRITAIAAPNGEGKTTLLKVICGLRFPDSGNVSILGHNPQKRLATFLQQLYFLPAEPSLPNWSPKKIGKVYGKFYPNFTAAGYHKHLDDFKACPNTAIGQLSTGQQRRVQLAFALSVNTPLLLLDEPTLGLDIAGKDQFRRSLIQAMQDHQSVIIATHQLAEVAPILDDLIILQNGRIHSQINIQEAFDQLSFNLTNTSPKPFDGTYGRRVPGGWLVVSDKPNQSNAQADLETLYLALTEGGIKINTQKIRNHV